MMTREVSDLDINRHIRQVLVRFWIDLGRLSIRTTGGVVMIRGLLAKVPGSGSDLNSSTVSTLFTDIRRINGVKRIQTDLTNWINTGDGWQPGGGAVGDKIGENTGNDGGTWTMGSETR
jgi:hypothetical protein